MTTSLNELETQLAALKEEATKAIALADTLEQLEQLRVSYLGKKGQLSVVLRGMGKLAPEDRPRIGALANVVKEALQENLEQKRKDLQSAQIQAQLALSRTPLGIAGECDTRARDTASDCLTRVLIEDGFAAVISISR